jgi:heat shock protein HspQ
MLRHRESAAILVITFQAALPMPLAMKPRQAKYRIGQVVRHRIFPFRGVVFDIDPIFNNTEEWWLAIPEEIRPAKDQPFYHLLAENAESEYIAYVSEQNLLPDTSGEPLRHPELDERFTADDRGGYRARDKQVH